MIIIVLSSAFPGLAWHRLFAKKCIIYYTGNIMQRTKTIEANYLLPDGHLVTNNLIVCLFEYLESTVKPDVTGYNLF